jgi:uroporphyrinogen decarboxylase
MTSRERVRRALTFEHPDRAPRELWALPAVQMLQAEEFAALVQRFPGDFGGAPFRYGESARARGDSARRGTYVDEWGSTWQVAEDGVIGEVKWPALASWDRLAHYEPPFELLDGADLSQVNEACARSELSIRAGCCPRPFERMQFLRGSEALFLDLAYGVRQVYQLRDMVHDYYLRELGLWLETDVDHVQFMDDWGTQDALLISPAMWRSVFRPLYRDYCDLAHAHGKFIFFHSDGHIEAIYPDLIEIGVDAVNSQLFCMDIEGLAARYKGKITFWGEIDRQHVLPFGTVDEVRQAVRRVRRALDDGTGGVIAECEWGKNNPPENIAAVFETWEEPLP